MISAFALVYDSKLKIGFLGARFIAPNIHTELTGLIITLAGSYLAIAARCKLGENWSGQVTAKKDHELIQTGPYAPTRHPIYTGMFFGLTGAAIVRGEIKSLTAIGILFIALKIKMEKEQKFMRQLFPAYDGYAKKTRKIIPFCIRLSLPDCLVIELDNSTPDMLKGAVNSSFFHLMQSGFCFELH